MDQAAQTTTAPMPSRSALSAISDAEAVTASVSPERAEDGRRLIILASVGFAAILLLQILSDVSALPWTFENWRPLLIA
jgi:hypothetical protein